MTDTPEQLLTGAAGRLQPLVTALEARLNQRDGDRAAAGQRDLLRRWCQVTRQLYTPAWWTSARDVYDAQQAVAPAQAAAKQAAADAAATAHNTRETAKLRQQQHRQQHPPINL